MKILLTALSLSVLGVWYQAQKSFSTPAHNTQYVIKKQSFTFSRFKNNKKTEKETVTRTVLIVVPNKKSFKKPSPHRRGGFISTPYYTVALFLVPQFCDHTSVQDTLRVSAQRLVYHGSLWE